ncbi:MAG TPA: multidrug efflux RND transporter permease subunit [Bryobacteraceae bacterium]|nr:multidrug efflux RND transporter permease subunit [Bryobacteraceae bacterium]
MGISEPFIHRPVATTLLSVALGLSGAVAYRFLPVGPLPQVDFPAISIAAALPGASPETMASSVATPLERQFGRIAGINEMTSSSSLGVTGITLQFELNRNIDAAARDVQAAINAARGQLPANLPQNPSWRKVNPADNPIVFLALTSETMRPGQIYDVAATILQQRLSQLKGVGQVVIVGSSSPGVRIDVNPTLLNNSGIGLEDVRTFLSAANANRPKGEFSNSTRSWSLSANDQMMTADEYRQLVVAYRNGAPVKLSDVAKLSDSVEDIRTAGFANGRPGLVLLVFRQPRANVIETCDLIRATLPQLQASVPPAIHMAVMLDSTIYIRASVKDVQLTMCISVGLVILVVFLFLRNARATLIPSVTVPLSLVGTFGVLYLFGYSVDNLSLMALTIATGFVVDDAIVVIENITRYIEQGAAPLEAAVRGAREIGFTVFSISMSLIAVFIPILLMDGFVGRLFREFAITLSAAIVLSLFISLTLTPMMCARLPRHDEERHGKLYHAGERAFQWVLRGYERSLGWVLRHQALTFAVTLATIGLSVYLYIIVPKGFFPQQDVGTITGQMQADQSTSFQAMRERVIQVADIVRQDPAVENVVAFEGGGGGGALNTGRMFITLKPLAVRKVSADQVIARLRPRVGRAAGVSVFLQAIQALRIGTRIVGAQYQYTLQSDSVPELNEWAPKVFRKLRTLPQLADVNTDQQDRGLQSSLVIDRGTASRFGITSQRIDDTLYDAFGQRQVSTLYSERNQYHVVMEVDPSFWQTPDGLKFIYLNGSGSRQVPLSAFTRYEPSNAPLSVNHQGLFPSVTISFNLPVGTPLGEAVPVIEEAERQIGLPSSIHGSFAGTAQAYQESLANEPILIAAALVTVYIVLGMLYESLIHPITILSTLPSAGVGALLALVITHNDLNVISFIGIILLIGIVKKNAIMMIDFALEAERRGAGSPETAIFQACLLRFRPILMTTLAALLGGLPLALGTGVGAELRRPLGIAIVGGLIFSQLLTMYTTPVMYLYLDRLRSRRRAPVPLETAESRVS